MTSFFLKFYTKKCVLCFIFHVRFIVLIVFHYGILLNVSGAPINKAKLEYFQREAFKVQETSLSTVRF